MLLRVVKNGYYVTENLCDMGMVTEEDLHYYNYTHSLVEGDLWEGSPEEGFICIEGKRKGETSEGKWEYGEHLQEHFREEEEEEVYDFPIPTGHDEKESFVRFLMEQGVYHKFKRNLVNYRSGRDLDELLGSLNIKQSFFWSDTPEGHDFWKRMDARWNEIRQPSLLIINGKGMEEKFLDLLKKEDLYDQFMENIKSLLTEQGWSIRDYFKEVPPKNYVMGAFVWAFTSYPLRWYDLDAEWERLLEEENNS